MTVTDGLASADLQPPWWRWSVDSSQDLMQGWPNASTGSEGWPSVFGIMLHKQRYISWPTANKHEWIPWSPVMHMRHMMTSLNGNISALLALCVDNSPVTSEFPHQSQWRGALISFTFSWINGWVYNSKAGDWRRHRAHYDVPVIIKWAIRKMSCSPGMTFCIISIKIVHFPLFGGTTSDWWILLTKGR